MNRLEAIATRYSTGLAADFGHGDKGTWHSYLPIYHALLERWIDQRIRLLEVGVAEGLSLQMWAEYLPLGSIYGMDRDPARCLGLPERCQLFGCDSTDSDAVCEKLHGRMFEWIIDDGSHALGDQLATWNALRPHLAAEGWYVIEDVENLDVAYEHLRSRGFHVLDLRLFKGRHDDVLAIYHRE